MSPIGLAVYSSITSSKGVFILGLAGSMGSISLFMTLTLPNNISSLELSPAQMCLWPLPLANSPYLDRVDHLYWRELWIWLICFRKREKLLCIYFIILWLNNILIYIELTKSDLVVKPEVWHGVCNFQWCFREENISSRHKTFQSSLIAWPRLRGGLFPTRPAA